MFNLEQAIIEWRGQMLAAGIKTPVPLEELEGHLRDDIDQQMRNGISAQAAFDMAVERLGHANVLKREFKCARFDLRCLSPVYLRVYCALCAPLVLSLIWTSGGVEAGFEQRYVGAVVVSMIALYVGGLPLFYRQLFSRQYRLMCAALRVGYWLAVAFPAFALLSVFVQIHLGKLVEMVCWSAFAAYFATYLACANFDREAPTKQAIKLASS